MLKVFTKIEGVEKRWGDINSPIFSQLKFLDIYYKNHPQVKHLFAMDNGMRLYAHIFKITFNKTKNYLKGNSLTAIFLSIVNFKVLYLTNSYLTNVPAFSSSKAINLNELLNAVKDKYSLTVIPDFLFDKMVVEDDNYTKIEVEEEMVLEIRKQWTTGLEDYISDLKKKYRNKVKRIIQQTNNLEIRKLDLNDLALYTNELQKLFDQVAQSARFKGPAFNTASFESFVSQGFMTVDGYFLDRKLVGFSSGIHHEKILYAYFVGFDKKLNTSIPIYGRILLENITEAIKLKKESLVLGRTANEYKSNFGAYPVKSFVYLKVENRFLRAILKPALNKLSITQWIQRNPFISKTDLE